MEEEVVEEEEVKEEVVVEEVGGGGVTSSGQCKASAALATPSTVAGVSCSEKNSVHRRMPPRISRYMHALSTLHIVSCVISSVPL